jgi:DNA transformation protein
MDRDYLAEMFADFGPVTIRRMFSGFGISADGINFALALRGGLYLRADSQTIPRFEAERARPFRYQTKARTVTVNSYWQLPERLYDDPQEFGDWARAALAAAHRAALRKPPKTGKKARGVTENSKQGSIGKPSARRGSKRTAKRTAQKKPT